MPERKETEASFQSIKFLLEPLLLVHDFHVCGIWADATKKEMKANWPPDHPVHQGLVYKVGPDDPHQVLRGTGTRTNVYPVFPNLQLNQLELKAVHNSSRALLVDFDSAWLLVQYLTHTSIQLYSKDTWRNSVCKIPKKDRKWKLGLGIEFENFVLAFVSKELLFQATWARSKDAFKVYPDISQDPIGFMQNLVGWMKKRLKSSSNRDRLAADVIREATNVWPGVGVYTVNELLWLAGIPHFVTEGELFDPDNPSQVVRFFLAYYGWDQEALDIWKLVRPTYRDGIFAPTKEQREAFSWSLHVYGKDRSKMTPRMFELRNNYNDKIQSLRNTYRRHVWSRAELTDLYDVFEPTYLKAALEKFPYLGHLVFGKAEWLKMGGTLGDGSDPLSKYFKQTMPRVRVKGWKLPKQITHLHPGYYDSSLFVDLNKNFVYCPTLMYRGPKNNQMWTNILAYPEDSIHAHDRISNRAPAFTLVKLQTAKHRNRCLFKTLLAKGEVAIGPLEYAGTGYIYKGPGGVIKVAVSSQDPGIPVHYCIREAKGLHRKELALDSNPKKRKLPMDKEARESMQKLEDSILISSSSRPSSLGLDDDPSGEVRPKKKSRRGADQMMAQQCGDISTGRASRSKSIK